MAGSRLLPLLVLLAVVAGVLAGLWVFASLSGAPVPG
jgi:hypothetical protein